MTWIAGQDASEQPDCGGERRIDAHGDQRSFWSHRDMAAALFIKESQDMTTRTLVTCSYLYEKYESYEHVTPNRGQTRQEPAWGGLPHREAYHIGRPTHMGSRPQCGGRTAGRCMG